MEDEPEIGGHERSDHRAAIHDAADLLEPLRELDVVDRGIDRRKRAEHLLDPYAWRERRVALGIEGLGLGHAAGHPQHDDRVGRRLRWSLRLRPHQLRLAPDQRAQRPRRGRAHESAPAQTGVDVAFFAG